MAVPTTLHIGWPRGGGAPGGALEQRGGHPEGLSYCAWAQDAAGTKMGQENRLVSGLVDHRYPSVAKDGTQRDASAQATHMQSNGSHAANSHITGNRDPSFCDIPSGCCSFTGPWTVTRSSLCMLRQVAAFCCPPVAVGRDWVLKRPPDPRQSVAP